jgi:ribosomal protein S6
MAKKAAKVESAEDREAVLRVYEAGYHIVPQIKEEDLDATVAKVRAVIEKVGGTFVAEGAPVLMKLAYPMTTREGDKNVTYDRSYFGWLKFEAPGEVVEDLTEFFAGTRDIFRSMVFKTIREDTRAKIKAPALREVKRGDALKTVRKPEEAAGPVSEEELDKALGVITE